MFDALTRLYEGRNINRKMNLRTQLKNTKMQKGETIHDYFSRISQFKEQLEAIGDNLDEDELILTTLNGLTRPWDAFIQTICARKEKLQFDSLWEECVQEEARVANREAVLSRDEDQALDAHAKGGKKRSSLQEGDPPTQGISLPKEIHIPIKNLTLQGDSRSFRKVKEEKRISHLINVTIVTRWDILLRIVQLEEKNTRREITKDTMPMQLKMMSHP
jgi:hypothetical protein